jgi:hypothetical protein
MAGRITASTVACQCHVLKAPDWTMAMRPREVVAALVRGQARQDTFAADAMLPWSSACHWVASRSGAADEPPTTAKLQAKDQAIFIRPVLTGLPPLYHHTPHFQVCR